MHASVRILLCQSFKNICDKRDQRHRQQWRTTLSIVKSIKCSTRRTPKRAPGRGQDERSVPCRHQSILLRKISARQRFSSGFAASLQPLRRRKLRRETWLPRQPVNGTAVAIRTQAEPANGERHFPTKRDKWRKSVVFPPYYSARASAPAAAREFHNFIAKTLSSKTPPRLIRKGRRAYHGGLSGMKCA